MSRVTVLTSTYYHMNGSLSFSGCDSVMICALTLDYNNYVDDHSNNNL